MPARGGESILRRGLSYLLALHRVGGILSKAVIWHQQNDAS
jgi:hypothetical protein